MGWWASEQKVECHINCHLVPPHTDSVPPSGNHCCPILTQCTVGCPSQTCFFENQNSQPIPMVFGGWFEGSQEDFWFDYSNALVLNNLRKIVLLFDKNCNTSFMASLSLRGCQICKYKSLLCLRGEIVFYIMQIQRTSMSICMQWARQTFSTKDLENTFPLTSFKHHSSGGNRIFSSQGQA